MERSDVRNRPSLAAGRKSFTYHAGTLCIPEGSAPDVKNRDWTLTAENVVPKHGADGVLTTQGGRCCGWTLFVKDGKPVFHYTHSGIYRYNLAAKETLEPGKHTILFEYTVGYRMSLDEKLDCGEDTGMPASSHFDLRARSRAWWLT